MTRDYIIYERNVSQSIITKLRDEFHIISFSHPTTFAFSVEKDFQVLLSVSSPIRIKSEIRVRREEWNAFNVKQFSEGGRLGTFAIVFMRRRDGKKRRFMQILDCLARHNQQNKITE